MTASPAVDPAAAPTKRANSALGDQTAVFRLSRRKPRDLLWIEALFCLVLVVGAYWEGIAEAHWVTLGALVFFGVQYLRHTGATADAEADRAPRLIVDSVGVTIPEIFAERVPWSAIEAIAVTSYDRHEWISLRVDDLSRYGYTARGLSRLASAFGRANAAYDIDRLDGGAESVRIAIRRFAPAQLKENM